MRTTRGRHGRTWAKVRYNVDGLVVPYDHGFSDTVTLDSERNVSTEVSTTDIEKKKNVEKKILKDVLPLGVDISLAVKGLVRQKEIRPSGLYPTRERAG